VTQLAPSIMSLDQIDHRDASAALVRWGHRMGPCLRPYADLWSHGLFLHSELIAVTVTAGLVRESCGGLSRDQAIELARLCSSRPDTNRLMLRAWRVAIFPAYQRSWAVSYQDEALHTGNTYRLDGWVKLARSRSGTDTRGGRKGRNKTIWGWHADLLERGRLTMAA
jgi:hypothetical protein